MRLLRPAGLALLALSAAGNALAADFDGPAFARGGIRGEASLWAQAVLPALALDDGFPCGAGGFEFCENAIGTGGYAALQFPVHGNLSALIDGTFDAHTETSPDPTDRDDPALYGGIGLHLVHGSTNPWGVFGVAASGKNVEEEGWTGLMIGGGIEKRFGHVFLQVGALLDASEDPFPDDSFDDLFFARIGGEHRLAHGIFDASFAGGGGDFDHDPPELNPGFWLQATARYTAPVGESGASWFVAYQGDFVWVIDTSNTEQVLFNALKIGLTIPLGRKSLEPLPFGTPNFRALTSVAELN